MDHAEHLGASLSQVEVIHGTVEPSQILDTPDRLLTFSMGTRETFAIPVDCVTEVSVAPPLDSLAGAGGHIAGMLVWRGEVAYVYYLSDFLLINARPNRVLMMLTGVNGRRPFGVLIDAVGKVVDVLPARFHEVPAYCKVNQAIASVVIDDNDRLISVLNTEAMFGTSSRNSH